ncbi:hypothetical protein EDB89DRAFT_1907145 [Lactarius sanguifluus]|nr:hypothetical protein EDB89DRAFT_1907145 [Lactarius sanguifluus]
MAKKVEWRSLRQVVGVGVGRGADPVVGALTWHVGWGGGSCGGDSVGGAKVASAAVASTRWPVVHKGSHAPRGGVGDGCGGGSVEGVVTGVEVAVAVTGTTGCATYCVFTQKLASLRASTGVGGSSNGSGGNGGDLYMHEGRRGQRRHQLKIRKQKEPIMQWIQDEREKKKKKMAPGRMTARGWLACTCDAYEGDCNTRVDSATWTETATSSGHLTGLTCHSPVCMQTHCRRLAALVVSNFAVTSKPLHLHLVFESPVRSGFLPNLGKTGTATGPQFLSRAQKLDRTVTLSTKSNPSVVAPQRRIGVMVSRRCVGVVASRRCVGVVASQRHVGVVASQSCIGVVVSWPRVVSKRIMAHARSGPSRAALSESLYTHRGPSIVGHRPCRLHPTVVVLVVELDNPWLNRRRHLGDSAEYTTKLSGSFAHSRRLQIYFIQRRQRHAAAIATTVGKPAANDDVCPRLPGWLSSALRDWLPGSLGLIYIVNAELTTITTPVAVTTVTTTRVNRHNSGTIVDGKATMITTTTTTTSRHDYNIKTTTTTSRRQRQQDKTMEADNNDSKMISAVMTRTTPTQHIGPGLVQSQSFSSLETGLPNTTRTRTRTCHLTSPSRPHHLDMAIIRTLTPPRRHCFDTAATPTSTQQLSSRHDAAISSQPLPPPQPPRHRYHHLNCHDAGTNSAPLPPPRRPTQHTAAARPHCNTTPSPPITASTVPPTSAMGARHPRTPFPIGRAAPCAGRGMMPPFPWRATPYASTGHPDPTSTARNGATPTWPHQQCHLSTDPIAAPPTTHARTVALWRLLYYTINSYM